MAILNRFSTILLYCDSALLLLLVAEFLAIPGPGRDSGNRAVCDLRFCAAKVRAPRIRNSRTVHKRLDPELVKCTLMSSTYLVEGPI